MPRLNQIIAVEKPAKQRIEAAASTIYKTLQKPVLFEGMSRVYQSKVDGDTLPAENTRVQQQVGLLFEDLLKGFSELLDLRSQIDNANTMAKGTIRVWGEEFKDIPVTTLMSLEKLVSEIKNCIAVAPVLDLAEDWTMDKNSGLQKSATRETARTAKVQKPIVLYPHSDKHPAQTQLITTDEVVGNWQLTKISGAIAAPIKKQMLDKVEQLAQAIKHAREEANMVEAPEKKIAQALLGPIFAE